MDVRKVKLDIYEDRGDGWQNYDTVESEQKEIGFADIKSDKNGKYFLFPYTSWGDYVGGTAERANYTYLKEIWGENPLVFFVVGGYDSHAIMCHTELLKDEKFKALVDKWENYLVLDDDTLSNIETELQKESWESWIKYDLPSMLKEAKIKFNKNSLEDMFWYVVNYNEIDFIFEDAVSATIDLEKVVENWMLHVCPSCEKIMNSKGEICETCPTLPLT